MKVVVVMRFGECSFYLVKKVCSESIFYMTVEFFLKSAKLLMMQHDDANIAKNVLRREVSANDAIPPKFYLIQP